MGQDWIAVVVGLPNVRRNDDGAQTFGKPSLGDFGVGRKSVVETEA